MPYGLYFCKACGACYHEVRADKYDPNQRPNATWFRLKPFYRNNGWGSFPENDPAFSGAELWCPGCGASYMGVHENTWWFDDKGKGYGRGPVGFQEVTQDRSEPEEEPEGDPEEEETEQETEQATEQESEPQVYEPKKKNTKSSTKSSGKSGNKKRSGKGSGKKREALKNLSSEEEVGNG